MPCIHDVSSWLYSDLGDGGDSGGGGGNVEDASMLLWMVRCNDEGYGMGCGLCVSSKRTPRESTQKYVTILWIYYRGVRGSKGGNVPIVLSIFFHNLATLCCATPLH